MSQDEGKTLRKSFVLRGNAFAAHLYFFVQRANHEVMPTSYSTTLIHLRCIHPRGTWQHQKINCWMVHTVYHWGRLTAGWMQRRWIYCPEPPLES